MVRTCNKQVPKVTQRELFGNSRLNLKQTKMTPALLKLESQKINDLIGCLINKVSRKWVKALYLSYGNAIAITKVSDRKIELALPIALAVKLFASSVRPQP